MFSSNKIYFCQCQKADEKKSKEDEQTLEELNSAHRRSQAKCQYKTVTLNELTDCSCFCYITNIFFQSQLLIQICCEASCSFSGNTSGKNLLQKVELESTLRNILPQLAKLYFAARKVGHKVNVVISATMGFNFNATMLRGKCFPYYQTFSHFTLLFCGKGANKCTKNYNARDSHCSAH